MSSAHLSPRELGAVARIVARYQDAEIYVRDALQVERLSPQQAEILRALPSCVAERRPLYLASGHALGKDFLAGAIPLWWQETRYPAKTILTGPTERQVHEITWNELKKHLARRRSDLLPLGGTLLQDQLRWDPEHFILAFTTSPSESQIGKAQGFHSPHMLVIVTESQAVPDSVKEQLDGLLTSPGSLFIAIGNPLVTTGWFAKGLRDSTRNRVVHLDCEESPNVVEGREVIPGMVSRAWVEEKRREWYAESPTHPLWLARVKGQLPLASVDTVFSRDLLTRRSAGVDRGERVSLGVDVAEFGDDESAFCVVSDGHTRGITTTAKHEPMDTAGRALLYRAQQNASVIVVDRVGVGSGVASALREMCDERATWSVMAFAGSESPTVEDSPYLNQRAEAYFYARDQLHLGRVRGPTDERTLDELCETRYLVRSNGKLMLESKADLKERLGRSPDRADAWVLAVWGQREARASQPLDALEEALPVWTDAPEPSASGSRGYGWR